VVTQEYVELDAVVMAAGEGRRMRPLTLRWPKPLLPIDGRAVIAVLLRELARAGLRRATIVTGHLAGQVEALVGDGSAFGLELRFARQPVPNGSADAVRRALAAGATPPSVVVAADTLFTDGDVGRFTAGWREGSTAGALAARRGFAPGRAKPGVRFENGLVEVVYDLDPSLVLTSAPLWILGPELVPYLDNLPGPPYELKDAYQRAIDEGLRVAGIEVGPTRDLTAPEDLVVENFSYLRA
jgi:NDP-sugar pyrophosphorylase family protein